MDSARIKKLVQKVEVPGHTGHGLMVALAPQVALGTYLVAVPDHLAFSVTQGVVAVHVLLGLATLPLVGYWLYIHARRRRFPTGEIEESDPAPNFRTLKTPILKMSVAWVLAVATVAALLSGLHLMWRSEGMPAARWHTGLGILPLIPLAVHLALARKWRSTILVVVALGLCVGSWAAIPTMSAFPDEPPVPELTFATRSVELYDSAEWCGECHEEIYEEWRHSTHARALTGSEVVETFARAMKERGVGFVDTDFAENPEPGHCGECHAPVSYYGNETSPILKSSPPASEGITCSFCHTLRASVTAAVEKRPDAGTEALEKSAGVHPGAFVPDFSRIQQGHRDNRYVSAPETIRRYFGQGAESLVLRTVGNLLIRWRPQVHRADYHQPFLDTSEACQVCHHKAYGSWEKSSFAGGEGQSGDRVHCQDCHMVKEMKGTPRIEPGQYVAWGPDRAQRRSHFFLGGNVRTMEEFHDEGVAQKERAFAKKGVRISLVSMARSADRLSAVVKVHPALVGHDFPLMEFEGHVAFVQLRLLNEAGEILVSTSTPDAVLSGRPEKWGAHLRKDDSKGIDWPGAVILKPGHDNFEGAADTTIPVGKTRAFEIALPLTEAMGDGLRVQAALFQTFDTEPIATAEMPMPARE